MKFDIKGLFGKKVVKDSMIYAITDGVNKSLSFLLLPFVSYFVEPTDYGLAVNFEVLLNILILLSGRVVINALVYFYYEKSKEEMNRMVSTLLSINVIVNLFSAFIILFITNIIFKYLQLGLWFQLLACASAILQSVYSINIQLYRLEGKPKAFSIIQITHTVIHVILVVILVIGLKMGAVGKIYSSIGAYYLMAGVHIYLLIKRRYLTTLFDKESARQLLKFGIPLLPHALSFWIKSGADKILITTFLGLATNGIYSMAMSFGAIYSLFRQSFGTAYSPYLQKRLQGMTNENREEEKLSIVKLSYKVSLGFLALYFLVVPACYVVIRYLLSDKYHSAFEFIPWVMLSLTIYSFYDLVIEFAYKSKKTLGIGLITFTGSLIQIVLTYFMIKYLGVQGVKYSLVIGSLIIMIGIWVYSNKVYPMPWLFFLKRNNRSIKK